MKKHHLLKAITCAAFFIPFSAHAITVDLLVVYDTYSKQQFNNQPDTAIRSWIDQINMAMQNSQVDVQVRLVGTVEHDVAGADMSAVLGNLRVDGFVAQKRNEVGADYVTMIDNTGNCGVGYVAVDKNWAFNVVGPKCGALAMAHELGHTMGLMHSRRQGDTGGARYSYGMGHGVDNSFATIMTYEWLFNAPKVAKYSNPRISCNGFPCGIPEGQANSADAARAVNNVRSEIAGFFPTKINGGGGSTTAGVTVYQHGNYSGYSAALGEGSYRLSDLNARGVRNDDLSSARIASGMVLEIFEHDGFAGTKSTYTSDVGLFPGAVNDSASSIVVRKSSSSTAISNGTYAMKARHSGKCADIKASDPNNGVPLVQWNCHYADNQRWIFTHLGSGYFEVKNKRSGRCADVSGAGTSNGSPLIQWDCHRGNNQQWQVINNGNGSYRLVARHSGKVADVWGVSQDNLAPLHQWDYVGGANQQFILERVE